MKKIILAFLTICILFATGSNGFAQQNKDSKTIDNQSKNLSWEEKVSPKYSYQLPEKVENTQSNALQSEERQQASNRYNQLLSKREELKFQIGTYEKLEQNETNKQYLEKYRASLIHIEKQIQEYKAPEKKPKSSN
jgi:TolA-binding protein